jgi:hypothetical protein
VAGRLQRLRHHRPILCERDSESSPPGEDYPEDRWYAWLNDRWVAIPPEVIVPEYAPDGRADFLAARSGTATRRASMTATALTPDRSSTPRRGDDRVSLLPADRGDLPEFAVSAEAPRRPHLAPDRRLLARRDGLNV